MEGSATVAAIGSVRIQDIGSGGPRPRGSTMDRLTGTLSGDSPLASRFCRSAWLQDARQRRVEHQPSAAQKHHCLEGRGVTEAVRPAHHQPNLVVEPFHHAVAQPRLGVGDNALLVLAHCLRQPDEGLEP